MSERGGYQPLEEARPPIKFTRRHFLELAGAGALIGKRLLDAASAETLPAEPIKVSPPEPPDNLPVEETSPQRGGIEPSDEASAGEGTGVHKKDHKKKNKKERWTRYPKACA